MFMADEMPTADPNPPEPAPAPPPAEAPVPDATVSDGPAAAPETPPAKPDTKHWYVVKVQSGREESIKEAIERRVKIEGLEEYFGQILIPTEKVTEMRKGKRYVKERKLYPGYLMVNVDFNENILYLFRETSGVGDFVGGSLNKPPQPMKQHEIDKMLNTDREPKADEKVKLRFDKGDRVKIRDGAFIGMEGEVKDLLEAKAHVRVEVTIFGRPVSVELEYWQVEPV
jgi:transcriptional antiterminator NusG